MTPGPDRRSSTGQVEGEARGPVIVTPPTLEPRASRCRRRCQITNGTARNASQPSTLDASARQLILLLSPFPVPVRSSRHHGSDETRDITKGWVLELLKPVTRQARLPFRGRPFCHRHLSLHHGDGAKEAKATARRDMLSPRTFGFNSQVKAPHSKHFSIMAEMDEVCEDRHRRLQATLTLLWNAQWWVGSSPSVSTQIRHFSKIAVSLRDLIVHFWAITKVVSNLQRPRGIFHSSTTPAGDVYRIITQRSSSPPSPLQRDGMPGRRPRASQYFEHAERCSLQGSPTLKLQHILGSFWPSVLVNRLEGGRHLPRDVFWSSQDELSSIRKCSHDPSTDPKCW